MGIGGRLLVDEFVVVDEFAIDDELVEFVVKLVDDCDDGVVGVVVISGDDGGELVVVAGSPLALFLRLLVIISLFGGWCFFFRSVFFCFKLENGFFLDGGPILIGDPTRIVYTLLF